MTKSSKFVLNDYSTLPVASKKRIGSLQQSLNPINIQNTNQININRGYESSTNNDDRYTSFLIQLSYDSSMNPNNSNASGTDAKAFYSQHTTVNLNSTLGIIHDYESYIYRDVAFIVLIVLVYGLVLLLAICGNVIVIIVVISNKHMHTLTNYFIVNLALADLLLAVFCMPTSCVESFAYGWHLGPVMCKLTSFFQGVSVIASVNTLAAISFDRYLAICQSFDFIMTRKMARGVILVIWIWALLIISPWIYNYQQVASSATVNGQTVLICISAWENPLLGKIHLIGIVYVFCYVIPLISISVFYALIAKKVWFRPAFLRSNESCRKIVQRSKTKVVKMLLLVVFMFALSWLPLLTLYVYMTMNSEGRFAEQISKAMPFLQFLGQSNSCINPIIYCLYSSKFRKGIKQLICFRNQSESQNNMLNTRRSTSKSRQKNASLEEDNLTQHAFSSDKRQNEVPIIANYESQTAHQTTWFKLYCCKQMNGSRSSFSCINSSAKFDQLNNRTSKYGNKLNEADQTNLKRMLYSGKKNTFEMHNL